MIGDVNDYFKVMEFEFGSLLVDLIGLYKKVYGVSVYVCGFLESGEGACWGKVEKGCFDVLFGPFIEFFLFNLGNCGFCEDGTITCWGEDGVIYEEYFVGCIYI